MTSESVSLKEYFEMMIELNDRRYSEVNEERDKALRAALASADKRLELLNELRGGVATKEEVRALEKIINDLKTRIDKNEGKGSGVQMLWGLIAGGILLAIAVSNYIK